MGKSDDKPWVKKPDIIMEQLEDRIVFAADVANAEPVAAVTVQAQAQAEAPSGEAPAPSGGAQAASASPDAAPPVATAVIDFGTSSEMQEMTQQGDPVKIDLSPDDGGGKAFWIDAMPGAGKLYETEADAKAGTNEIGLGAGGASTKLQDDTVYFVADGGTLTDTQLKFHTTETQVQTKVLLNETFDKGDSYSGDQFDHFQSKSASATWTTSDSGGQEGDTDGVLTSTLTYPSKKTGDFGETAYLMTGMDADSSDYHVSVQFNADQGPSFGVYYYADAGSSDKMTGFMFEITPLGSHTSFGLSEVVNGTQKSASYESVEFEDTVFASWAKNISQSGDSMDGKSIYDSWHTIDIDVKNIDLNNDGEFTQGKDTVHHTIKVDGITIFDQDYKHDSSIGFSGQVGLSDWAGGDTSSKVQGYDIGKVHWDDLQVSQTSTQSVVGDHQAVNLSFDEAPEAVTRDATTVEVTSASTQIKLSDYFADPDSTLRFDILDSSGNVISPQADRAASLSDGGVTYSLHEGVLDFQFPDNYSGSHKITVQASDEHNSILQDFTFSVADIDQSPLITEIGPQTFAEDGQIAINLADYVSDRDTAFSALAFTVKAPDGAPVEAHVEKGELVIKGLKDSYGDTRLELSVMDGKTTTTQTINVTVTPDDDAPMLSEIGPQKFEEEGTVRIDLADYITDVDTDFNALKITVTSADGKLVESHVSDGKLVITGVHDAHGETKLTLSVSDGATTKTQTIDVTVTPENDLPVATDISVNAVEDVPFKITLSAKDVDSTDLTYVINSVPADGKLYASQSDALAGRNPLIAGTTLSSGEVWFKADANENSTESGRDFSFSYVADDHSGTETIVYDQFKAEDVHAFSNSRNWAIDPDDGSLDLTAQGYQRQAVMVASDTLTDFTLDVSAELTGGTSGGMAVYYRISEGAKNSPTGYAFQIDPGLGMKFVVREVVDGKEPSIPASVSIAQVMKEGFNSKTDKVGTLVDGTDTWVTVNGEKVFNLNAEHDISISVQGSHHVINVDGIKVLDFYDSKFSEGGIGFRAWSNTSTDTAQAEINSVSITTGGSGLSDPAKVDIHVAPVNDAPVLGTIPSVEMSEDGTAKISLSDYIKDVDTDFSKLSFTVKAPDGSPVEAHVEKGELVITGKLDAWGKTELSLTVSDGTTTQTEALGVNVRPVDDAPVLSVPSSVTTSEDTSLSFTDSNLISVTDIEADHVTVTLTAANGTLTAGIESGSEITLSGTPTEVSVQLASLSFAPTANYNGAASITVHSVETDTSKALGSDAVIDVTVTPVNDAPEALSGINQSLKGFEDSGAIPIEPIVFGDVEGDVLTVTLRVQDPSSGVISGLGSDSSEVVLSGTPSQINDLLKGISFNPALNYYGLARISIDAVDSEGASLKNGTGLITIEISDTPEPQLDVLRTDVLTTTTVESEIQESSITSAASQGFVLAPVGLEFQAFVIGSAFDAGSNPRPIGGEAFHTWSSGTDDPWATGVDFGGSTKRAAEEWFTGLDNFRSNVDRGAVLRVGQAEVATLADVTKSSGYFAEDSTVTYASVVGNESSTGERIASLNLQPELKKAMDPEEMRVSSSVMIDPNDVSFEKLGLLDDKAYPKMARNIEPDIDQGSLGIIDPDGFSFIDLETAGAKTASNVDRSEENVSDGIARAIDLDKVNFEDLV